MLRNRRKIALADVKEIDAFPKVPETYVETTASGGTSKLFLKEPYTRLPFLLSYTQKWLNSWLSASKLITCLFLIVSVVIFILIAIFVVSEIRYYSTSKLKFKYAVDTDYDR